MGNHSVRCGGLPSHELIRLTNFSGHIGKHNIKIGLTNAQLTMNLRGGEIMSEKLTKSNTISIIIVVIIGAFIISNLADSSTDNSASENKVDILSELTSSPPSDLKPTGQLKDLFKVPSEYTDLQRKEILNQIKGKIVAWRLPVYEIRQVKDNQFEVTCLGDNNVVACDIYIIIDSPEEKQALLGLKTGDYIGFKGILTGKTSMRSIVVDPAIIWDKSVSSVINNRAITSMVVSPFNCSYEDGTMWVNAKFGSGQFDEIIFVKKTNKNTCSKIMKLKKARIYYNNLDNNAPDCPMADLIRFEAAN